MFFGPKKRHRSQRGVSPPSDPISEEVREPQSRESSAWRRSARTVTRAWNEWLAASSDQRAESYRRYTSALAEEELAAVELARATKLEANAPVPTGCVAPPLRTTSPS